MLNLQVLQSFSLFLAQLRQSDAVIPLINFHWKDLSNQLDPSKYQRLLFGIILILMMIYRPAGITARGPAQARAQGGRRGIGTRDERAVRRTDAPTDRGERRLDHV